MTALRASHEPAKLSSTGLVSPGQLLGFTGHTPAAGLSVPVISSSLTRSGTGCFIAVPIWQQ